MHAILKRIHLCLFEVYEVKFILNVCLKFLTIYFLQNVYELIDVSIIQPASHSLTQSLGHSVSHTLTHQFTHLLINSLTHLLTHTYKSTSQIIQTIHNNYIKFNNTCHCFIYYQITQYYFFKASFITRPSIEFSIYNKTEFMIFIIIKIVKYQITQL